MTILMQFNQAIHKKEIVFFINDNIVDDMLMLKIIENIPSNKKIGLDMSNVQNINSPILIKHLLENKIKLFNLQSEVLTYFSLILKDGFLKSYMNHSDFSKDKRELIKRRFLVA